MIKPEKKAARKALEVAARKLWIAKTDAQAYCRAVNEKRVHFQQDNLTRLDQEISRSRLELEQAALRLAEVTITPRTRRQNDEP